MKQVCIQPCQLELDGQVHLINKGQIVEYAEEHLALQPIEGEEARTLDLGTAEKEELMADESWKPADAMAFAKEHYNPDFAPGGGDKEAFVDAFLDARFRAIAKARTS